MKNIALSLLCILLGASLMLNYIQYRQLNPKNIVSLLEVPNYGAPPTEACKETIQDYYRQQMGTNLVFEFNWPSQAAIDDPEKPGNKIYGWLFEARWNFGPGSQSNFPMASQFLAQSNTVILCAPIGGQFKRWGVE
jgi:hypothetical protein